MTEAQAEAWNEVKPGLPEKRRQVLEMIEDLVDATLYELVKALGWQVNCISGRLTELEQAGLIYDTGFKRVSPDSGRNQTVYAVVRGETQAAGA